jgi:hypothetical protein
MASAHAGLGRCALAAGDIASARSRLQQAHEIFSRIGAVEADELADDIDTLPGEGLP